MPLVLGLPLVSCASFATGYAQHEDLTLKDTNKRVDLDARMKPTLSPITTSVLACRKMFTSIWEQATVLPRRSHVLHDFITQVFLRSLQCGIAEMCFIDAFVYAHHSTPPKHRESWKLWRLHERENPLHDGYHSCPHSRIPGNMSNKTHACSPASELPLDEGPRQISASPPTFVLQHAKEAMNSKDWPSMLTGCTRLVNGETLAGWDAVARSHNEEEFLCLASHHHRGSSRFFQVPELTPTTPLKCRP